MATINGGGNFLGVIRAHFQVSTVTNLRKGERTYHFSDMCISNFVVDVPPRWL